MEAAGTFADVATAFGCVNDRSARGPARTGACMPGRSAAPDSGKGTCPGR
jgi:hypothetical protein